MSAEETNDLPEAHGAARNGATAPGPHVPGNLVTPTATLQSHVLTLLDSVDEPVAIASAIRDRDGRILDFRLEFANLAAARWAGAERGALIGLLVGDVVPEMRVNGCFERLHDVVEIGLPVHVRPLPAGDAPADPPAGGSSSAWPGGITDLRAIRLGDGYVSTWQGPPAAGGA